MASMFKDLASEDCLSARQCGKQYISTFYMKYNQSMCIEVEHSHVAYQWKAYQIFNLVCLVAFGFVAVTIFDIKS